MSGLSAETLKKVIENETAVLRARVAKLEAALKHAQEYMRPNQLLEYGPSLPEMLAAPQSNHLTDTSPEGVAEIKRVFEHCGEDTCRGFVEALIDALERERARVAKLEAALERVHPHICAFGSDEELAVIDAALSETVEA